MDPMFNFECSMLNVGTSVALFFPDSNYTFDTKHSTFASALRRSAGCSKRPDFPPAQPRRLLHPPALKLPRQPLRPGTRRSAGKAAASCHFKGVGWDDPNGARLPNSPFQFQGWPGRSSIARVERAHSDRARSASRRTTRLPFPSF